LFFYRINTIRKLHSITTPVTEELMPLLSTLFIRESNVVLPVSDEWIICVVLLKVIVGTGRLPGLGREMEEDGGKWDRILKGTNMSLVEIGVFARVFTDKLM
jgi:hypothetical protein